MKQIKVIIFILIAALTLSACSEPTVVNEETTPTAASPDNSSETTEAVTTTKASLPSSYDDLGDFDTSITIEETVLYDKDDVKITATELEFDRRSMSVGINIENNSSKKLSFSSGTLGYSCNSVNGYMVDTGYFKCDVSSGKKSMETVDFNIDDLTLYGIDKAAEIELGFTISDDDYNYIYTEPVQIKTSAFGSPDAQTNGFQDMIKTNAFKNKHGVEVDYTADDILYDKNGVKIISEALIVNNGGDSMLMFEMENTTSSFLDITIGSIAFNGLTVYSGSNWTADMINPGKRRIFDINTANVLDEPYWEVFGLKEIGKIDLDFKVSENDKEVDSANISIAIPNKTAVYDDSGIEVYSKNGIKISFKDFAEDELSFVDDLHALFLAENNSGNDISIGDEYDSLSLNGYMNDYSYYGTDVGVGKAAIIDIKIDADSMADNKISGAEDIEELAISLKIRDEKYNDIDEALIEMKF